MQPFVLLAVLPFALANPTPSQDPTCTDFTVPLTITAPFYQFLAPEFSSSYDATAFLLRSISNRTSTGDLSAVFSLAENQTKTYGIAARYCTPSQRASQGTVQLLTHGIGFDQSYWQFDYQNSREYDYAYTAAQAGYATLSYDRLGNGESSIVSPYNEQQALVELAILNELTTLLRSGKLNDGIPVPTKVVHVGHSYGSQLSPALAATAPHLTDGIVLTGFSNNYTWMQWFAISTVFHVAAENQPERFGNRSLGSLTWGDKYGNQYGFLTWPYFDVGVLEEAEATKFPFAVAELLTGSTLPAKAPAFAKPVLVSIPVVACS
jgi:pimeloyl-ACP methyl ester carboxylesterase